MLPYGFLYKLFMVLLPVLVSVAFLTLLERKVLGFIGLRIGPGKVSFLGIFQPISDAVKLSNKQCNLLTNFNYFFYYLSSILMIFFSMILWMCLYLDPSVVSLKYSVLFFMLILSFNSLNSIICGWSTFSKFSLIGSVRTVSQLISYEASLYICVFFFIFLMGSYNFSSFIFFFIPCFSFLCPFCFMLWLPSFLAELNRTPYDFSEGESELVSGFNTEFGSSSFTLIFLSEYANIIFFCLLSSFLFFLGYINLFSYFLFFVLWIRSVLPRFRFDKLMFLSWKFIIPFLTCLFLFFYNGCFSF